MLIIAPHALDEVLGCGGTIQKAHLAGANMDLLIMFGDGKGRDEARRHSNKKVSELLGIRSVTYAGFPENMSDTVPLSELIQSIEGAQKRINPKVVYVCHGGGLHTDHKACFSATMTAFRPLPGSSVREIYAYEVQSSTEWALDAADTFRPVRYEDISDTLPTKLEALRMYGDEMRPPPHARSIASAEQLARWRGSTMGIDAAEAFSVVRQII
ncbi:PIG-L family deacetylase [Rhodospirillales bacterium]|nr:PIG-L family deacetylase [Rhodospirillales bacterium]